MALKEDFESASDRVQQLPERPDNDILLKLYALYKQGTEGDVSGERPGMMDFKGRAKYDAWEQLAGKSNEDAMQEYIDEVSRLESAAQ